MARGHGPRLYYNYPLRHALDILTAAGVLANIPEPAGRFSDPLSQAAPYLLDDFESQPISFLFHSKSLVMVALTRLLVCLFVLCTGLLAKATSIAWAVCDTYM